MTEKTGFPASILAERAGNVTNQSEHEKKGDK